MIQLVVLGIFVIFGYTHRSESLQGMSPSIRYFESFAGYKIPFHPTGEFSRSEISRHDIYYVGTYEGNQLVSFEKRSEGQRIWLDTYTYWPDSKHLCERVMAKEDGSIVRQAFDKRGRLIPS